MMAMMLKYMKDILTNIYLISKGRACGGTLMVTFLPENIISIIFMCTSSSFVYREA
jgi:hypothetical protein